MRSGAKVAVAGGVFLIVAGGVGYGGYTVFAGASGETRKTGPLSTEEIDQAAGDFLTAWAGGRGGEAARLTNRPVEAEPLLNGYRKDARVSRAEITPGTPTGATVPFTVKATVTHEGVSKPWTYTSRLTVVRGESTGRPLVDWKPAVVHPELKPHSRLRTEVSAAPPIKALDREGRELSRETYPSLGPLLDVLRQKYGKEAGGTPGVELVVTGSGETADRTLLTLGKGTPGTLRTTLDAEVQAAAERAVKKHEQAAAVAIKPSTGEIQAVANNPAHGFNAAMLGKQAPGSTMKIVSAAMLLDRGIVDGPGAKVECPPTVQWDGATFQNLEKFGLTDPTFRQAFARSCNTTFIKAIPELGAESGSALGATAKKYFGIGLDWKTGVPSFDGDVPVSAGTETAASYMGQGRITMNALNVASISATAKNGAFKQPVLVPADLDGRKLATAEPLPAPIAAALREMMRATAVEGSGAVVMGDVSGDKGAKTGSAEVNGQKSNSWFTAYADDLAVAAVVQAGGRGGEAAGPVVTELLNAR
ncbi:penicillin-binding transpeptidase domain-containing protein [Streptomyces clavuligerus]|uniref:Penicillin-binding protein n=1 Tax=Streptomyces clavuligerus TaxID=1901 RepID=B5GPU7_STRCL|nr:penicillin-binding transpeptidase domain-containing protein [Streptomyces clavuligerus]ANW19799.1 penicillin-binding protein [Streptomyces clavuligerus]AXU14414.1 penicillin-binding protein [Streptomyces clavuligerus]EDY48343.1 penicillin-binding protein [Streptomyces clavuligerus]EFG07349.1 Penicillin-binding protein [Streptomyces clavuligerus]MBY6304421.1 penicillin-binding protein [Streptomyces clavuligerus]